MSSLPLATEFRLPFPPATFGNRFGIKGPLYGPQGHRGTDFVRAGGTPIPAIAAGKVVHVMWSNALGNVTVVKHYVPGGGDANDVYSGYCHQSQINIRVGQTVRVGQIIGRVGTTGTASTGNHLHLTMSHDDMGVEYGEVFDPISYINGHAVISAPTPARATFTTARKGEGLAAIAARAKISLSTIERLNPGIRPPSYIVLLGQKVRIK
jgi:murein DD-endopeptidase MepM/ murein hydrolase activator NlpD